MPQTNLNPLFIELIRNFAHLLTPESQTKEQFLETIKTNYSIINPKTALFYSATQKSTFETIRLNASRETILLNQ